MKTEAEIREMLSTLEEAHRRAIENKPKAKNYIESLREQISIVRYILGTYDED